MAISSFMAGDASAQQPAAGEQAPAQKTALPQDPAAREDLVRQALLSALDLNAFLDATHNGYSADLAARGAKLTHYLQREEHSSQARAVYLDPNEFTALESLNLGGSTGAAVLMNRARLPGDPGVLSAIADSMHSGESVPFEGFVYTQDPHTMKDLSSGAPQAAAIVPASAYFPPSQHIEGLTHEQNIEFINRHEGWHMADVFNLLPNLDSPEMKTLDMKHPEKSFGNPAHMAAVAMVNRQECLADVGAAGDMIRNGADPSLIGKVIAWREQGTEIGHLTAGALERLQNRINEMGLDKFRALDDDSARRLYEDTAVKGSLQPAQTETVLRYTTGTPAQRAALDAAAAKSPETKAALDFVRPYVTAHPAAAPAARSQEDIATMRQLATYHPAGLLKDRAFADAGKITPMSLAKAYGELQNELRQDLDRAPDNKLWQGQANKLQQTFINIVKGANYVEENAARGVDIIAAEPALKDLAAPAAPAAPQNSQSAPPPRQRPRTPA